MGTAELVAGSWQTLRRVIPENVVIPSSAAGAVGPDLYRAILARKPAVKCIFMSGYSDLERSRHERDAAVPLLAKPWTLGELLQQVRRVLDRR